MLIDKLKLSSPRFTSLLLTLGAVLSDTNSSGWGFFGHKLITTQAVYSLPSGMLGFYKSNLTTLERGSVRPDMRRYIDPNEGVRHYIDLDLYPGLSNRMDLPGWNEGVELYTEDFMNESGILPWAILTSYYQLQKGFEAEDLYLIIRSSSDLAHYVGDAHVPLHTVSNYNGQKTGQHGIHGLWETRVPEISSSRYSFWVGKAQYVEDPREFIWNIIRESHEMADQVLQAEKKASIQVAKDRKYEFVNKGSTVKKAYSQLFAETFENNLDGMVESQMQKSVRAIADLWFTCWVNAGQPLLTPISLQDLDMQHEITVPDSLQDLKNSKPEERERLRIHN